MMLFYLWVLALILVGVVEVGDPASSWEAGNGFARVRYQSMVKKRVVRYPDKVASDREHEGGVSWV